MQFGIRIKQISNGNETEYWFDKIADRDHFIKIFSKENFMILEYMTQDQVEFNFDSR